MKKRIYDYLIVGSGAGGATLAQGLARRKKDVLVVEAGKIEPKLGTLDKAIGFYDTKQLLPLPATSREGVTLWRTIMAGGSTVVSCANGIRCLEKELRESGIDLAEEFAQAEKDTSVAPIADRLLSDGSRAILQAAKELGYTMEMMPKFINPKLCRKCGHCSLGCENKAKWTALDFLEDAIQNGCEVIFENRVKEVISENGKVKGVRVSGKQGHYEISAKTVILSAGGTATPVILQNSGIKEAGSNLFCDLFVNVYGISDDDKLNLVHEPMMSLVNMDFHHTKGFLLSPFVNHQGLIKFVEHGIPGLTMPDKKTLGLLVKIADEPAGRVYANGSVSKPVTGPDWEKLKEGSDIARQILLKSGAKSMKISKVQGAHPGGTAAIGKITDSNLQTKIDGLFVCDASVIPVSPGAPPILTIIALAKRLAKILP